MRHIFVFLFCALLTVPAISDTECPVGYGLLNYTRLEYIKSKGGAYIDTQYHPVKGTHIYFTIIPYSANGLYFGVQNDLNLHSASNYQIRSCGIIIGQYVIGQEIEVELWRDSDNYRKIKVDGNYYQGSTSTAGGNIWLFADSGGTSSDQALKEVLITTDGVNSMNFIPVKRNSDGAVGMYDTVSRQFFTNAGKGSFIAGPAVLGVDTSDGICSICPPNTYKDFVGNSECTPCPDTLLSPSGSTSINDCGRALWVGGKVLFMSSAPRTAHTLNVMDSNGNIFYGNLYSEQ